MFMWIDLHESHLKLSLNYIQFTLFQAGESMEIPSQQTGIYLDSCREPQMSILEGPSVIAAPTNQGIFF